METDEIVYNKIIIFKKNSYANLFQVMQLLAIFKRYLELLAQLPAAAWKMATIAKHEFSLTCLLFSTGFKVPN